MNNTIFVSVANYRDRETSSTVDALLDNAKYPDNIGIGLLNQVDIPQEVCLKGKACSNVRQEIINYKASKGVCWARNWIITHLLQNEEYLLQIDSHSRFIKDWDEVVINQHNTLNDINAVITQYPVGYTPPNNLQEQCFSRLALKGFDTNGLPEQQALPVTNTTFIKPQLGAFFAGGCAFGKSDIFRKVPYDPYLYFTGEEITMAVRLYTHGYNIYHPNIPFMWHYYNTDNVRTTHWQDNKDWFNYEKISRTRIRHLLGIENSNNLRDMLDFHKYGLGTVRTLESFQEFAGVNFKNKTLEDRCITASYS